MENISWAQITFLGAGIARAGSFAANASSWSPVSDFVGLGDNFYTCGINCGIKSGPHEGTCDRFTTRVPHTPGCAADESNFRFHDVFEVALDVKVILTPPCIFH